MEDFRHDLRQLALLGVIADKISLLLRWAKQAIVSVHETFTEISGMAYLKGRKVVGQLSHDRLVLDGAHFGITDEAEIKHKSVSVVFGTVDPHWIAYHFHFAHVPGKSVVCKCHLVTLNQFHGSSLS